VTGARGDTHGQILRIASSRIVSPAALLADAQLPGGSLTVEMHRGDVSYPAGTLGDPSVSHIMHSPYDNWSLTFQRIFRRATTGGAR
jgi:hypothetical protein